MLDHFDLIASIYDRLIGPPETERLQQLLKLPTDGWLLDGGGGTGRVSAHLNGLAGDHLSTIAQSVEARARTLWNVGTLSAIVLAGGGALALRQWLEPYFAQAIYAPDAAMANVTGFLRYGMRKWR